MSQIFAKLRLEYRDFADELEKLEEDVALARARSLLEKIQKSGRTVSNLEQRNILSHLAMSLGEIIFNLSGEYPSVRLEHPVPIVREEREQKSVSDYQSKERQDRVQKDAEDTILVAEEEIKSSWSLEYGPWGVVLVTIIIATIGYFLQDFLGDRFGLYGGIRWTLWLLLSLCFGMLFFAYFLLPVGSTHSWLEGLDLLLRHYSISPSRLVHATLRTRANTMVPCSFRQLGAGIVKAHQVLAVIKGSSFVRSAGPGFVVLHEGENVAQIIDLRAHSRKQPVKANTSDGIPLETSISLTFRVRQSELDHNDETLLYPYDKEAIFHVSYIDSIDSQNHLRPWTEQLAPRAATLLVGELAKYTLNQLQQPVTAGVNPLDSIKKEIKRQLDPVADRHGIELLSVGVGPLKPPEAVADQRVKTWQAEWQRKMWSEYATTNAEAARRIKKARARAQVEIIETITHNIESMRRDSSSSLTEIITLRMIQALEEAVDEDSRRTSLPPELINTWLGLIAPELQKLSEHSTKGE